MKTLLSAIVFIALATAGMGYDFSEEAGYPGKQQEDPCWNDIENPPDIIDLLTRCKDDIQASIRETEILANLYNSVATDGSKVAVDRSSESFKLLEDIEAALKALQ